VTASEKFVSRWARLKREAVSERNDAPGAEDVQVDSVAPPNGAPTFDQCNEMADERFDPGSLPPIESITAETDISGFLRSRVPAELTRAALRRTWASDPAIRDFIGIAENQWDFNDPNSIPGFGALNDTDNVPVLLQQALGAYEKLAEPMPTSVRQAPSDAVRRVTTEPEQSDIPEASSEADSEDATAVTEIDLAAQQDDSPAPRRSHGGALPR
jgi:hypothetical protein